MVGKVVDWCCLMPSGGKGHSGKTRSHRSAWDWRTRPACECEKIYFIMSVKLHEDLTLSWFLFSPVYVLHCGASVQKIIKLKHNWKFVCVLKVLYSRHCRISWLFILLKVSHIEMFIKSCFFVPGSCRTARHTREPWTSWRGISRAEGGLSL